MTVPRRERLKSELREEILDAARQLFVKEGYGSVGMRKIADAVGCSPGTLYLHFADKAAILSAICVETFAILDRRMEAMIHDQADPLTRLRRGGRLYIQFGLDHPHHYFLTFATPDPSYSEEAGMAGQRCFDGLRQAVRGCIEEVDLLRSTDIEEMSQVIWSAVHGLVMLLIAKGGHFPFIEQNRLIESVLDMVFDGIKKR